MSEPKKEEQAAEVKVVRKTSRRLQKKMEMKAKRLQTKIETFNESMVKVAPELASKFAVYPINYSKWLNPNDEYDGEPLFIKADHSDGVKMNYVWGKIGPKGHGYYHLLTRFSYVNLNNRLEDEEPYLPCCGNKKAVKEYNDYLHVVAVVKNRSHASVPNDKLAKEEGATEKKLEKEHRDAVMHQNNVIVAGNVAAVAVTMGAGAVVAST